ncbi:MAG: hypothetical protein NWE89_03170 [Candidatus Bathyarchaeota archaeon]|nr:hypothetical protein [Candidatus Bathyarchaeota archaeon]
MALELTTDMIVGISALIVAGVAILMFMRATGGLGGDSKKPETESSEIKVDIAPSARVHVPDPQTITKRTQVEEARSKIRMLTIQQEILSMVMKRLFEAEDDGEITKVERERLSKNYDGEIKSVTEDLNKAELIVSLNELEDIRSTIIKEFQNTLTETQTQIDRIIGELNIEPPKPVEPEPEMKPQPTPRRRPRPVPQPQDTDEEEPEVEDEERPRRRDSVEERLDKLKEDVLKELEELDRLELEG